jgi:hypothetical protein
VAVLEVRMRLPARVGYGLTGKGRHRTLDDLLRSSAASRCPWRANACRGLLEPFNRTSSSASSLITAETLQPMGSSSDQDKDAPSTYTLACPASLYMSGGRIKLVLRGSGQPFAAAEPDPTLLRTLVNALQWFELLRTGDADSIASIAAAELVGGGYVPRVLRLAFLSPLIIEQILNGTQPPSMTADGLRLRTDIPLDGTGQHVRLLNQSHAGVRFRNY